MPPPDAGTKFHKRYQMEMPLDAATPDEPPLPPGFWFVPWSAELLEPHAIVKSQAFAGELDAEVFPNLASYDGCLRLMHSIAARHGFCPAATWLVACADGPVGTVQGVSDQGTVGALQNLGVIRPFRGLGLGQALLRKCLAGFRQLGLGRAMLEVTAENSLAVGFYRRHGFRAARTVYKPPLGPQNSLPEFGPTR